MNRYIKNRVRSRCKMLVKSELKKLGVTMVAGSLYPVITNDHSFGD
ncbi:hypothetical protein KCTC52924_03249 [Arenibacter antarcticus]